MIKVLQYEHIFKYISFYVLEHLTLEWFVCVFFSTAKKHILNKYPFLKSRLVNQITQSKSNLV